MGMINIIKRVFFNKPKIGERYVYVRDDMNNPFLDLYSVSVVEVNNGYVKIKDKFGDTFFYKIKQFNFLFKKWTS